MKVAKSGSVYLMRLEPGDEVIATIQSWCQKQGISNAVINGIGSFDSPTLAHYRRDTKKFSHKVFEGIYEVASINGNVGIDAGEPVVHLHAVISDASMQAFAGHVVQGKCSATMEIVIQPLETEFKKSQNDDIGLKVWDFDV